MGSDVDTAFADLHVEAVLLVDPLVGRGVITSELGLGKPLQL